MELLNGSLLVLCEGKLYCFKREENSIYKLYKKYINQKQIIYSMIELDENSFLITCGLNNYELCHFQIYDSNDVLMTFDNCCFYRLPKNKHNVCKFNEDFVLFCFENNFMSNENEMMFFNFRDKIYLGLKANMNHFEVYKIFNQSFIGVTKFNGKYSLNQIEMIRLYNNFCLQSKCGFLSLNENIDKLFIIDDMIIFLDIT